MRVQGSQIVALLLAAILATPAAAPSQNQESLTPDIVYTAVPAARASKGWDGARLVRQRPDGSIQVLSKGVHSAADPEISFDSQRVLFAAKQRATDHWQIFESDLRGGAPVQLTHLDKDCRQPVYQSRFFTLDAPTPWDQVVFVAGGQLHTIPLEEARRTKVAPQQITFVEGSVSNPVVAPDGRVLFLFRGGAGAAARVFGVNLDGTDYALFAGDAGTDLRSIAVWGEEALALVAAAEEDSTAAGRLGSLSLLNPRHSFAWLAGTATQRVHSVSGEFAGTVLISAQTKGRYAIARVNSEGLNSEGAAMTTVLQEAGFDLLQPQWVKPRKLPDGRGSVVDLTVDWALLYCLNAYEGQAADGAALKQGSVAQVRVLQSTATGSEELGTAPVEADGSFHLRVPANRALRLELLDSDGATLRRGGWIYARNKEARGCIGCHEDPELTPPNREPLAVRKPPVDLTGAVRSQQSGPVAVKGGTP
jgi:hypothetical protein